MSERFQSHSPARVNSLYGLSILASVTMAIGILLLPIDMWSRCTLLVGSLMVIHMTITMTNTLHANRGRKVLARWHEYPKSGM